MSRQRPHPTKDSRSWEFVRAIFDCQIGVVKVDFTKLATKLGYKNERCASDMYHRFRRKHLNGPFLSSRRINSGRSTMNKVAKKQYYINGKQVPVCRDDDEERYDSYTNDDDEDYDGVEGEGDERGESSRSGGEREIKMEEEEGVGREVIWGLGMIDLEGEVKVKVEPGIKREPGTVVEEWVWD